MKLIYIHQYDTQWHFYKILLKMILWYYILWKAFEIASFFPGINVFITNHSWLQHGKQLLYLKPTKAIIHDASSHPSSCKGWLKMWTICNALQWRHNDHDGVSNHQPHGCLLSRLFRRRSKKTSKLRVTGLCVGKSPGTGEFPAQMASNAENVSIWWHHHGFHNLAQPTYLSWHCLRGWVVSLNCYYRGKFVHRTSYPYDRLTAVTARYLPLMKPSHSEKEKITLD